MVIVTQIIMFPIIFLSFIIYLDSTTSRRSKRILLLLDFLFLSKAFDFIPTCSYETSFIFSFKHSFTSLRILFYQSCFFNKARNTFSTLLNVYNSS